ncbi:hypothetical protein [Hymenobacter arcticus]
MVTLLAGLLALGLYLYVVSPGLAGTADSYHYLSAAYNLQATGRLVLADGSALRWWPPLFAVVLSIIGSSGGVQWLNGLSLLGSLATWSAVGYWLLPARRAWALPLLLALGSPALVVSKFVWSEPLFNWLWASYFLVLLVWLRRGGWRLGLLATVLGCLLPLQRIAGVFLVAGVGAGLFWFSARPSVRPSRLMQAGHLLGAISGLVMWQLHSSVAAAATLGPTVTLAQAAADYGFVLGRWLVPLPMSSLALVPASGWVAALVVILLLLWPLSTASHQTSGKWPSEWTLLGARLLYAALLVVLLALIVSAMRARAGHGIQEAERYITALYPPTVLLVLLAWPSQWRWATRLGPALLGFWLLYQGVRAGHNSRQLHQIAPIELTYPHPTAWWEKITTTDAP